MRNSKRPGIISTMCALGLAGAVIRFIWVFSPAIKKLGLFMPAIYGIIICGYFVSYIGLWHMKRWGAELYVLSVAASVAFNIATGTFGLSSMIGIFFAMIWITVLAIYYKKMDANL